jgi:predicted permease
MEKLWQDIRYSLRQLLRSPGFSLVAILTLAVGIGANTAIFSVVYSVILRPLPYPQPERIMQFGYIDDGEFFAAGVPFDGFKFIEEQNRVFSKVAGTTGSGMNLSGAGSAAERVHVSSASADFFNVLGVQPTIGRSFTPEEDSGAGEHVAILANGLWKRRFGSDAAIIGRAIMLDETPYTVVGVMPAGFQMEDRTDLWAPLALVSKTAGNGGNISVMGRLKDGMTLQQARAQFATLTEAWGKGFPQWMYKGRVLGLDTYQSVIVSDIRAPLLILFGAIAFVLLIACANVANLLLTRATSRSREIAIRISLGASRTRLLRQLLTESLLLALFGGVLGLVFAQGGLDVLLALTPSDLPRASEIGLNLWALGFTFAVSLLTGLLFGLAPAMQASRMGPNDALKETSGRATSGGRQHRLRSVLVVSEVALSLTLLAGATLLMRTFTNLLHTDAGFDVRKTLAIEIWSTAKHNDPVETANYYRELTRRIESLPGVEAVGVVAAGLPLARGGNTAIKLENGDLMGPDYREVSTGFLQAMGIPLRMGRYFTEADSADAARVVIVNEAFAKRVYPNRNPIGAQINMGGKKPDYREIVGVVGNVKSFLDRPVPRTVFIPAAQASSNVTKLFGTWFPVHVVVRAADPLRMSRAVEEQIRATDPNVPIGHIRSMEQAFSKSIAFQNFMMVLLGTFAGLAMLLAAIGIYGVMAYSVSQRTHELGIRMALGAQRSDVFRLIVGHGMLLALVGVALGIAGGLAATRLLADMLYGVKPTDPWTFMEVSIGLLGVALLACYVPARRAMRVDPMVALRYE